MEAMVPFASIRHVQNGLHVLSQKKGTGPTGAFSHLFPKKQKYGEQTPPFQSGKFGGVSKSSHGAQGAC